MIEQRYSQDGIQPPNYGIDSWIDPRVVIQSSPIEGRGLFATSPIRAGEVVIRWGGKVFTEEEIKGGLRVRKNSMAEVGEGLYMAEPIDGDECPDEYMNHSCDPSLWMADAVTLIARRDIVVGEEITADYAMWSTGHLPRHKNYIHFECRCGSPACRGAILGDDWQRPELQESYRDHFSPYIMERIKRLTAHIEPIPLVE